MSETKSRVPRFRLQTFLLLIIVIGMAIGLKRISFCPLRKQSNAGSGTPIQA